MAYSETVGCEDNNRGIPSVKAENQLQDSPGSSVCTTIQRVHSLNFVLNLPPFGWYGFTGIAVSMVVAISLFMARVAQVIIEFSIQRRLDGYLGEHLLELSQILLRFDILGKPGQIYLRGNRGNRDRFI